MSVISESPVQQPRPEQGWVFEPGTQLILEVDFSLKRTVWILMGWHGANALGELLEVVSECSKVVVMVKPTVDGVPGEFAEDFEWLVKAKGWDARRIALVSGEEPDALAAAANAEIDRDLHDQWKPVITKTYAQAQPTHVGEAIRAIAKIFNSSNLEKSTRTNITGMFVKNLLVNFASISSRYALADVQDTLKNRPAVVVAAGPSLNKQLPILKKYQHLLTLIAVDSVWSVLTEHGIVPDIVVALDALNVPAWTPDNFDPRSLLMVDVGCNQSMFESVSTPMLVTSNHPSEAGICTTLGAPVDTFPSGGSVATKAFNLALWMGANPVIFVGQDLAYTDGKDHADGYQYAHGYASGLRTERSALGFDVEGYYGGRVRTERQFMHYKAWFEGRIKQLDSSILVINCTEGGARIEGTAQLPLATVCNELASVFNNKPVVHGAAPSRCEELSLQDRCKAIEDLRDRLAKFRRQASEGLRLVEHCGRKTLQKTLKKIDRINQSLQQGDQDIKYLIDAFAVKELQQVRKNTVRDDRTDDTDKISLERYSEIYESIEAAADVIDGSLQRLLTCMRDNVRQAHTSGQEMAKLVWAEAVG